MQPLQSDRPWWQTYTRKLIDYKPIRGALAGVLTFTGSHGMLPQRVFAGPLPQEVETELLVAGAVADTPTGNKGLVFQDLEVIMVKRDPQTLVAIRDSAGQPIFEDKPSYVF